jgi:hypothetical protein
MAGIEVVFVGATSPPKIMQRLGGNPQFRNFLFRRLIKMNFAVYVIDPINRTEMRQRTTFTFTLTCDYLLPDVFSPRGGTP